MKQKKIVLLFLTLAMLAGVAYFLLHTPPQALQTVPASSVPLTTTSQQVTAVQPQASLKSHSQRDTQINCQIQLTAGNALQVNEHTRDCFEYFLSQYGEKQIPQIEKDFSDYIQAHYPAPAGLEILDLWKRYLSYRQDLADAQYQNLNAHDPQYFQKIFDQTQDFRKRFFSIHEIKALFGHEDDYHTYTLKRLAIINDDSLSPLQKAEQLQQLFEQLPQDWQDNLKQLTQLEDLQQLAAEIKARGGSAAELQQLRSRVVGSQATLRLEQLDQQRHDWKQQVAHFLQQKDKINQSHLSITAKNTAIQQLRDQYFSRQQQLRLKAFESTP